jgi:hypothetical protein
MTQSTTRRRPESAGLGHPGPKLVAVDGPVGANAGRRVPRPDGGEPRHGDGPALGGRVLLGRLVPLGRVHIGEQLGEQRGVGGQSGAQGAGRPRELEEVDVEELQPRAGRDVGPGALQLVQEAPGLPGVPRGEMALVGRAPSRRVRGRPRRD